LTIGNDERAECAQALQCLVSMLLSSLCVDWGTRELSITSLDLLRLPDEVLEQVALVLCQEKVFGLRNNVANVGNESLALGGELGGRAGEGLGGEKAVERDVDLLVLRAKLLAVVKRLKAVHRGGVHTDGTLPDWKAFHRCC